MHLLIEIQLQLSMEHGKCFSTVFILLEFIIFSVKKYTSILLAILLTISIASCVFYTLCSLHKEKLTFLKYAFLAAKNEKPLYFEFSDFSL